MPILAVNTSPLHKKPSFQKPVHQQLAEQIRSIETANRSKHSGHAAISSGCRMLDVALPSGGYTPGTLIEWIDGASPFSGNRPNERSAMNRSEGNRSEGLGNGSLYLALTAARCAMQDSDKYVVIVDSQESFYPPAAQFMGIALDRMIVLRPSNLSDAMWAIDQSLRSSAVASVVARLETLSELNARRFQLAAEQSGALGLFLRPASARSQPSWSEIQWGINPALPRASSHTGPTTAVSEAGVRRIHVESLRMRGGHSGQHWTLMIDTRSGMITAEKSWERNNATSTSSMRLATQLAVPTSNRPAIPTEHFKRGNQQNRAG